MQQEEFKLILKSRIFLIPSNFRYLNDVNQEIYSTLLENKEYTIKSPASKKTTKSFIKHWITGEIPYINSENIAEYEMLSKEFDRMQDLLQIYKSKFHHNDDFTEINQNFTKNQKIINIKNHLQELKNQYQQIISIVSNNKKGLNSYSKYQNLKEKLYNYCLKSNVKFIELLMKTQIIENGMLFVLDEENQTASVLQNLTSIGNVQIPYSIQFQSKEFIVTTILENAFNNSINIISVTFPDNSEVRSIEKNSFTKCSLKLLFIPSSVAKIGKSAFSNCTHLRKVTFSKNSKLEEIEDFAFSNCKLREIEIPQNVKKIGKSAFHDCTKLKVVNFEDGSKLQLIEKNTFCATKLKSLFIPPRVNLNEGFFEDVKKLKEILVANNCQKYLFFNNEILIEKSDIKSNVYDALVFARKDLKKVTVPKFIKRIAPFAFSKNHVIETVEFEPDSKLEIIEKKAFHKSSIKSIKIPSNVTKIGKETFSDCCIEKVEFESDSKLEIIESNAFCNSSIKSIKIPSNVSKIGALTFYKCHIEKVDFDEDSKLTTIAKNMFSESSIMSITLPPSVEVIDEKAFFKCEKLKEVRVANNSKLRSIRKNAFDGSSIETIDIPANFDVFENEWSFNTTKLTNVNISKDNKKYKEINGMILMNSTNSNIEGDEKYDTIIFAKRNIKDVTIPKYVKFISSCSSLNSITIHHLIVLQFLIKLLKLKQIHSQIVYH